MADEDIEKFEARQLELAEKHVMKPKISLRKVILLILGTTRRTKKTEGYSGSWYSLRTYE